MTKHLEKIHKKIESKDIANLSFFHLIDFENKDDCLNRIYIKYYLSLDREDWKKLSMPDKEADVVFCHLSGNSHILIQLFNRVLLSFSRKYHEQNDIKTKTLKYVNLFFNCLEKKSNDSFDLQALLDTIKVIVVKYPSLKEDINSCLFKHLINDSLCVDVTIMILKEMLSINECNILTNNQIEEIYDRKKVLHEVIQRYTIAYYDFYNAVINNAGILKKSKERFENDLCSFILLNIDVLTLEFVHDEIPKVRYLMDKYDFSDNDYLAIDKKLEEANQYYLSHMQKFTIELPPKITEKLTKIYKKNVELFNSISNSEKIDWLMLNSDPFSKKSIERYINNGKHGLLAYMNEVLIDSNGGLILYNKNDDDEKFSIQSSEYIHQFVGLYFKIVYEPFDRAIIIDDELKNYLNMIMSNNPLVLESQKELLVDCFIKLFSKDYLGSIPNIVTELDRSLRYFFKSKGLNIKKKNRSGDFIGLSDIFNNYKTNKFREELLKKIDEDYYFLLKWLLVDKAGYGLRHKIAHRNGPVDFYKQELAIYTCIQIFRLYWGFQP